MNWHHSKPYKCETGPIGGVSLDGMLEEEHGKVLNVHLTMGIPPSVMLAVKTKGLQVNSFLNIERARILARMLFSTQGEEIGGVQLGGMGDGATGRWLKVHRITRFESVGPYLSLNTEAGGLSISTQLSAEKACELGCVLLEACEEAELMTRDYAAAVKALDKEGGAQ